MLTVLAVAVVAAPARLAALDASSSPAPMAQSAQAANPAAPSHPDAAASRPAQPESEADQDNKFLQSPTVRKIAQLLHLSVGATKAIGLGINFVVFVLLIGIPLFRMLPKMLRKKTATVQEGIASARQVTEDANARLSAIEAKLAGLDGEIAQIRTQMEEESKQDEARIKSTIGEESARIVAAAEQEISSATATARRSLRHFAADLAFAQAGQQLKLTAETDQALLSEFLEDLAANGAGDGGRK